MKKAKDTTKNAPKKTSQKPGTQLLLILIAGAGLAANASGAAPIWTTPPGGSALSGLFSQMGALDRLKNAVKEIQTDRAIQSLLRNSSLHSLMVKARTSGKLLETTKFQHYYQNLEVVGSMAFHLHNGSSTEVLNQVSEFDLNTTPTVSPEDAIALVRNQYSERALETQPELKILNLRDRRNPTTPKLVYWVNLEEHPLDGGRELIIDAQSGEIIADIPKSLDLATSKVYSAKNQGVTLDVEKTDPNSIDKKIVNGCQVILMQGGESTPSIVNPTACKLVIKNGVATAGADASAKRAASNSQKALAYYFGIHGRDGFDGQGSAAVSVVHVGNKFDNAAWMQNKSAMMYGDGDGVETRDYTYALDVAGHEMTHGVVMASAKLLSMGDSGALNEAYADFFGKMIASDGNWAIGKQIAINPKTSKGFRDLAKPEALTAEYLDENGAVVSAKYPSLMKHKLSTKTACNKYNDRCFVHINATIPGHAAYLAQKTIGKEKTEALYYLVLTQLLGPTDSFEDSADKTMLACKNSFDTATCASLQKVYDSVGM
ncbi:M4 family metallopeptidase [Bdellovibrionota bacterium FG-2]